MYIEDKLNAIPLPKQYVRNGKNCYLDPYRKRLIEVQPEETVRQRVAKYCETKLSAPAEMIRLEIPMSKHVKGAAGRADIIIYASDDTPLIIVECKNTDIAF